MPAVELRRAAWERKMGAREMEWQRVAQPPVQVRRLAVLKAGQVWEQAEVRALAPESGQGGLPAAAWNWRRKCFDKIG